MATAKTNSLRHLASYDIRPALVEAKLITQKHAGDAVYMVTLSEELLTIEAKITAMEEAAHFGSSADAVQFGAPLGPEDWSDANWIRAKSRELELRLRRIEQSPVQAPVSPKDC
jgi:hypothetical protein